MKLYFVRHGKAVEAGDPEYPDDTCRPLIPQGIDELKATGRALAERDIEPAVIWTSPLVRARETAEILAKKLSMEKRVVASDLLRPGFDLDKLARLVQSRPDAKSAMVVGHEPDFSTVIGRLIAPQGATLRMAKGSVALVELEPPIRSGSAELIWLVPPKWLVPDRG
jgi:phosphohistidine phosphatase